MNYLEKIAMCTDTNEVINSIDRSYDGIPVRICDFLQRVAYTNQRERDAKIDKLIEQTLHLSKKKKVTKKNKERNHPLKIAIREVIKAHEGSGSNSNSNSKNDAFLKGKQYFIGDQNGVLGIFRLKKT